MSTWTIEWEDDQRANEEVQASTVSPSGASVYFFQTDPQDGDRVSMQIRTNLIKAIYRAPTDVDGDYTYTLVRLDSQPDFVVKSNKSYLLESMTESHAMITEGQQGPVIFIRWDLVERITRTITP